MQRSSNVERDEDIGTQRRRAWVGVLALAGLAAVAGPTWADDAAPPPPPVPSAQIQAQTVPLLPVPPKPSASPPAAPAAAAPAPAPAAPQTVTIPISFQLVATSAAPAAPPAPVAAQIAAAPAPVLAQLRYPGPIRLAVGNLGEVLARQKHAWVRVPLAPVQVQPAAASIQLAPQAVQAVQSVPVQLVPMQSQPAAAVLPSPQGFGLLRKHGWFPGW